MGLVDPTLVTIAPTSGPHTGSTNILITGNAFSNTSEIIVRFQQGSSNSTATAVYMSPSQISCVTPESPNIGSSTVQVAMNGQQYGASSLPFLFYGMNDTLQ